MTEETAIRLLTILTCVFSVISLTCAVLTVRIARRMRRNT